MSSVSKFSLGRPKASAEKGVFSLSDLQDEHLERLVDRSCSLFINRDNHANPLDDRLVGILFTKTSTRTRTAFSTAALRLGAKIITYGPNDLQLATGESIEDTAQVLGGMLDILVARTAGPLNELRRISQHGRLSVVNAMASEEHPTQGICDLATLKLHFGELGNLSLLYVGEGNNTASAFALGISRQRSTTLTFLTPPGYGLPEPILSIAKAQAAKTGSTVRQIHDHEKVPGAVDVVYTTRWQTTGTDKADAGWREVFRPYYVDSSFISRWPDAIFMHDLPAHRGDEVSAEVLDGEKSLAWVQAEMKMTSAMAILESLSLENEELK